MKEKLTDKEIVKWCKILGCKKMLWLDIDGKIYLTPEQREMVIGMKQVENYNSSYDRRPRKNKYVATKRFIDHTKPYNYGNYLSERTARFNSKTGRFESLVEE